MPEQENDFNEPSFAGPSSGSEMFHRPQNVVFQDGSQPHFTNVHGDHVTNIYSSLVATDEGQKSTEMDETMAGRIQDAQSSCTGSESASYCSHLLRQGRGFPLYTPGPPGNSPVEYQRNGVSIGDVGRITADGVFDFFFNIYLDAEDPINADFVPDDFVPLGLYKPRDVRPQEFDPGNWVSSAFIQVSDLDAHWDNFPGSEFLFSCTGPNGAVLALPHGAHLQKLENVEPVRQYAAKYAESWYRYLNRERGRGLANGSLYLITGWEKSQSGGMASFQNISPETSFQLSFVPTTDAENGYNYRFKKGTPAFTKHFASHSHGEQAPPNQTTFLHGFSISLGEALWWKLFRDANIFEISDSRMRNSQNALMSFDIFSWLFKFSSWLFGSRDAATSGKEEIAISDLSPTRETVHPGRSINAFLLYERPEATVVITHDDDWKDILRSNGPVTLIKDTEDLLEQIAKQFWILDEYGAFFLVSKSSADPRFLPCLYMALIGSSDPPDEAEAYGAGESDGSDSSESEVPEPQDEAFRRENEVEIALMGPPGSGKTSFIKLLSGYDLEVEETLQSGTNRIKVGLPFQHYGKQVRLIDIPGFGGSSQSETDIFAQIAAYLAIRYEKGRKLSGIIYMHHPDGLGTDGISQHNVNMFRHIFGDSVLKSTVIVVNMRGEVAEAQEVEMVSVDRWFFDNGVRVFAHHNKLLDALGIIHSIIETPPCTLQIQPAIIDFGRDVLQTAAGKELNRMLRRKQWAPYTCELCGDNFTAKHNLRIHRDTHNLNLRKDVACPTCNKTFGTNYTFDRHVRKCDISQSSPSLVSV